LLLWVVSEVLIPLQTQALTFFPVLTDQALQMGTDTCVPSSSALATILAEGPDAGEAITKITLWMHPKM